MKWINSTARTEKRFNTRFEHTAFNYVDKDNKAFGGIVVSKSGINWYCENSHGPADSAGHAKRAVEKLVRLAHQTYKESSLDT